MTFNGLTIVLACLATPLICCIHSPSASPLGRKPSLAAPLLTARFGLDRAIRRRRFRAALY